MRSLVLLIALTLGLVAGLAGPVAADDDDDDWRDQYGWWQNRDDDDDDNDWRGRHEWWKHDDRRDHDWDRDWPRGWQIAPWWNRWDGRRYDDDWRYGWNRNHDWRDDWKRHDWGRDNDGRFPWLWQQRHRGPLSMDFVVGNLKRYGYRDIGERDRRDGFYWINARNRHNDRVTLKIDPYSGRILDQRRR